MGVLRTTRREQVLDSNGSGGLTSLEFCAAMKKLVRTFVYF